MNAVLAFLVARWFLTLCRHRAVRGRCSGSSDPFLEFLESWVVRLVI